MFKRIDHVEIVTAHQDQTIAFYTDVLGFKETKRDRVELPNGAKLNMVYLDLGGTVVELMAWDGVPVGPEPQKEHLGYRMIALEVDDMNATTEYLKEKGVDIVWGPMVRETYARAEISDPNGYRIELRQWF